MTNGASTRGGGGAAEEPPRLCPLPEKASEVDPELCLRRALSIALMVHKNERTELKQEKYVRFVGTSDLINFGLPLQKQEGWPVCMKSGSEESSAGQKYNAYMALTA